MTEGAVFYQDKPNIIYDEVSAQKAYLYYKKLENEVENESVQKPKPRIPC